MKRLAAVAAALLFGSFAFVANADDHHDMHGGGERQAPPKFQAHPNGVHPRGATMHAHQVRVLAPRVVVHGGHTWAHWAHPEFARPNYYWDWSAVHSVSCIAEDSYGDQYPVTETAGPGWGPGNMTGVEDDALDRCYSESGQDNTCVLATCSHY